MKLIRDKNTSVEFSFRIWVHPVDGDSPDIESWWHGLESTEPAKGLVTDWVQESLSHEDFHALFQLDEDKHWQVVGKALISGRYDHNDEYEDEIEILEYVKAEVPEEWLYGKTIRSVNPNDA